MTANPEERLSRMVRLRFTVEQHAWLESEAGRRGLTVSQILRDAVTQLQVSAVVAFSR